MKVELYQEVSLTRDLPERSSLPSRSQHEIALRP